jgi:hypothetical protein
MARGYPEKELEVLDLVIEAINDTGFIVQKVTDNFSQVTTIHVFDKQQRPLSTVTLNGRALTLAYLGVACTKTDVYNGSDFGRMLEAIKLCLTHEIECDSCPLKDQETLQSHQ